QELAEGLLMFGGKRLVDAGWDPDIPAIIKRGQLWPGSLTVMNPGQQSQCHRNSCLCWEANHTTMMVATGYALSKDGLWRQHSWCVQPHDGSIRIVETTEERIAYFGFVMTLEETIDFFDANVGESP